MLRHIALLAATLLPFAAAPAFAGPAETAFLQKLNANWVGQGSLSGAQSGRVACRTAGALGAVAVLCLAFPLEPPGRKQPQNRLPELDAVTVPTLVVQGESDPFGMPPPGPSRTVAKVPGNHALKTDPEAVSAAVRAWLADFPSQG